MDIDQMGGSTLQAMAEAVENAEIVLLCMSQKYKNSPNCRAGKTTWFVMIKNVYIILVLLGPRFHIAGIFFI